MADNTELSQAMDMLNNMLNSTEGQNQLKSIVSMLGGDTSATISSDTSDDSSSKNENPTSFDNKTETELTQNSGNNTAFNDNLTSNLTNISEDAEMILKLKNVMSALKSSENGKEAAFLKALSPFLSQNRQNKLDRALKLLGMSRALKIFKNM